MSRFSEQLINPSIATVGGLETTIELLRILKMQRDKTEIDDTCRWSTPREIFDPLDAEFGFDIDVCAEPWNAKCENYFSPDQDGLNQKWCGEIHGKSPVCWMNPPYGREIEAWIRKAYDESKRNGATVVCLVPARTETAWWHECCLNGEIRFVRGRIHFTDSKGRSGRPRFGSAVVIFRP